MIVVKVFGGLAQGLGADQVSVEADKLTVGNLISILESKRLSGDAIRQSNLLIFVNGVEVSTLDGPQTLVKAGDKVAIIPVAHGG